MQDLRKDLIQPLQQDQPARFDDLQKELKDVRKEVSKDRKVLKDAHAIVLVHQDDITTLKKGLSELQEAHTEQEQTLSGLQVAYTEQAQQQGQLLTRFNRIEKLEHNLRRDLRAESVALLERVELLETTDFANATTKFEPVAAARKPSKSAKQQQPYAEVANAQNRDKRLTELTLEIDQLKEELQVVKVQAQSLSPSTEDFDMLKGFVLSALELRD